MLQSARLKDYVTIQQPQEGKDDVGGTKVIWVTLAQVWAEIRPLRGRQFFDAFQTQTELSHKITIRHRTDVSAKMRVMFGTRTFTIEAPPIDPQERHQYLELMCAEGVKTQ